MTEKWTVSDDLRFRVYESYESYIVHQASKLEKLTLGEYNSRFRERLCERLRKLPMVTRGSSVLCLGARSGAECEAFVQCGCFAIGVDLNPGERNSWVVTGDFHRLQFADASVDIVYTNALDHALHFERAASEIVRVLKDGGVFVAEIVRGSKDSDGREPGAFESVWWDSVEAPIRQLEGASLTLVARHRFAYPWQGDQCVFRKRGA